MNKRMQDHLRCGASSSAMLDAARDEVRSALLKAEAQGVITVDWSDHGKPVVTVIDHAALDRVINPDQSRRARRARRRHETTSR